MGEKATPMDNLINLYEAKLASAGTLDEVNAYLSILPFLPPYLFLHIQYFYCAEEVPRTFDKATNEKFKITAINDKVPCYQFSAKRHHKDVRVSFTITPSSVRNLFLLSSLCYSYEWNTLVDLLLTNRYPKIVLFYWKQHDISKALKVLEGSVRSNYRLIVKELSLKQKREKQLDNDNGYKKPLSEKYDSVREWTSKSLSQVLDEALEREQWFKKVKFQLVKASSTLLNPEPIATCSVSKFGSISYNNLHSLLTSHLCKELEPSYEASIKLYAKRGLKENNYIPVRPIAVEYAYDLFDKDQNILVFRKLIEQFPYSSKAFYHSNPYFHASIADFKDSSSYDVFISNPKRILIIPQIRTSIEALERFISFIFFEFREGTVKEMDESWQTT